ncbi:fscRII [Rhodotorula toruloides]|uniref:FscRII n=1 Tax=Rhodotorula toruloides TaxID=5286 RepID=A0A511KHK8_RHOTO|nr:fscRII [Rhodotorula toruloides]
MGLHHLAMRFFDYAGLKPHVKMVAFKAVYIPVWFVDLSASASAVMGEESYNLTIESMRIPIPGFNLPPLSSMPLQLPEGVPTFRWNGGDVDPSIQTIPFTRHPLNIPQKLKSLPRRVARDEDDVGFDPSRAKFRMVANYATYIPVYLGEWEVESTEFESGTTRVTTCIFADSHKPRFCMYRQKTPDSDPEWTPAPASTFTVTISARPASISLPGFRDVATAKHMQKVFGARLQAAIDEIKKERQEMGDGFVEWTDVVPEGGIVGFVADQDRVCSYKTWEAINEAYTEALEQCEIASEFHDRLKEMPTSRMAIIRPSLRSPVQRADNSQFFDIVKDSVDKWRELVEDSKPDWLRKAEENEKSVVGRETSKIRTKERGRLTK